MRWLLPCRQHIHTRQRVHGRILVAVSKWDVQLYANGCAFVV